MLQQAADLLEEGEELRQLLTSLSEDDWQAPTPFKNWTVNNVVQHLHGADRMAVLALTDADAFEAAKSQPAQVRATMSPNQEGAELFEVWWSFFNQMVEQLGQSDPKRRVPWFGPDMGVMMFTTARQMETWAHAHDIYDLKRLPRTHGDRIKNIAVIGVRTYGWTFANRGMEPPGPAPHVRLTAPSGAVWTWKRRSRRQPGRRQRGRLLSRRHAGTQHR